LASRHPKNPNPNKLFSTKGITIGIVVSQWHDDITCELLNGALGALNQMGVKGSSIKIKEVPGSFELPLGAQWQIEYDKVDAVLCLGCIIKGETPHFEYISQAVAQGIMDLNLKYNIPTIFGVLTTNTLKQATDRSGGKHGNKGSDAAIAALEMLEVKSKG
jgi:6,7-dimethyl-8-ribityllumazine synthase